MRSSRLPPLLLLLSLAAGAQKPSVPAEAPTYVFRAYRDYTPVPTPAPTPPPILPRRHVMQRGSDTLSRPASGIVRVEFLPSHDTGAYYVNVRYWCLVHGLVGPPVRFLVDDGCDHGPTCWRCLLEVADRLAIERPLVKLEDGK